MTVLAVGLNFDDRNFLWMLGVFLSFMDPGCCSNTLPGKMEVDGLKMLFLIPAEHC